nr:RNA methyltransferase [Bacteroidales bacterium]
GEKLVSDLLPHFECRYLFATTSKYPKAIQIDAIEMKKITHLSTPSSVLAVFEQKKNRFDMLEVSQSLSIALDDIQDPGNLGTIIRVADWFGIAYVFCSPACADVYNSKTVKATMGALSRVKVVYVDLPTLLKGVSCPIFGTFMDGENIYQEKLPKQGIIVLGNEGQGISSAVEKQVTQRLSIPSFCDKSSESLNVAKATGLESSQFRRS